MLQDLAVGIDRLYKKVGDGQRQTDSQTSRQNGSELIYLSIHLSIYPYAFFLMVFSYKYRAASTMHNHP